MKSRESVYELWLSSKILLLASDNQMHEVRFLSGRIRLGVKNVGP